ncbi:MAG TPA: GxxExxY protein [Tepidisphaeraceae bacterium]|jgi:GxxExxY protein|nr:GxxExxY protein [Tepidisphaeraceae bacterium]
MNTDEHRWNALTERIIACVYAVSNELGCGFFESVYENAMIIALERAGLSVQQQARFKVFYQGVEVGEYIADLVVEGIVLLELKAVKGLDEIHTAQCLNLLRATNLPICLLVNFAQAQS